MALRLPTRAVFKPDLQFRRTTLNNQSVGVAMIESFRLFMALRPPTRAAFKPPQFLRSSLNKQAIEVLAIESLSVLMAFRLLTPLRPGEALLLSLFKYSEVLNLARRPPPRAVFEHNPQFLTFALTKPTIETATTRSLRLPMALRLPILFRPGNRPLLLSPTESSSRSQRRLTISAGVLAAKAPFLTPAAASSLVASTSLSR